MKKILGILWTITIAGSGMAGLVGNAPAPAKNNINYQQINNLENLIRNKRNSADIELLNWEKISDNIFINEYGIFKKREIMNNSDNEIYNSGYFSGSIQNICDILFHGEIKNYRRSKIYIGINGISFHLLNSKKIFLYQKNNKTFPGVILVTNNNKVYHGLLERGGLGFEGIVEKDRNLKELSEFNNKNIIDSFYFDEKIYLVSNDGKIYEHDLNSGKNNLFFNINSSFLYYKIYEDHFSLIIDDNKVYDYFLIKYLNDNNVVNLLNEWKNDYNKWENDVNRQIEQDVPKFTEAQKRTWKDDKNFQLRTQISLLKDKLNIIKNHDEINKMNNIILNLKNEINKIYENIDSLNARIDKTKEELDKNQSKTCEVNELMGDVNDVFSPIPVYSTITGVLKSITVTGCKIFNL
ncbi:hypothetical protein [Spiroplasma endosymbiont of Eupeodes luniger]|uniref:coiled-coil domain-containing protein n=1 Tax=Spiroplasma endosymbiont of Eupeodes luniger TaxID=3066300 RepID=UPI0030CE7BB0